MSQNDYVCVFKMIDEIRERLERNAEGIENVTLDSYLEAMRAWLEAHQRKYSEPISWNLVAEMLGGAAVYEQQAQPNVYIPGSPHSVALINDGCLRVV